MDLIKEAPSDLPNREIEHLIDRFSSLSAKRKDQVFNVQQHTAAHTPASGIVGLHIGARAMRKMSWW
jgi:hypothetical protein